MKINRKVVKRGSKGPTNLGNIADGDIVIINIKSFGSNIVGLRGHSVPVPTSRNPQSGQGVSSVVSHQSAVSRDFSKVEMTVPPDLGSRGSRGVDERQILGWCAAPLQ